MTSGQALTDEDTLSVAGVERTFLTTLAPYKDGDERIIGVIGIARDITERRRLAAERDALLARLQLHVERMPLAYILFDADLQVIDWNPAAERASSGSRGPRPWRCSRLSSVSLPLRPIRHARPFRPHPERGHVGAFGERKPDQRRTHHHVRMVQYAADDRRGSICRFAVPGPGHHARRRAEAALHVRDRAIQAVSQGILITDPDRAGQPDPLC